MEKYIIAWNEMVAIFREFIATPKFKNAFLWGIVLYAIALFALIRGDIFYSDDWKTSIMDISWNDNSRYLATFILNDLATLGKGAVDSSPLLQIMAVILVIISSIILLYLIRGKFDLLGIVASLPLGLSPHFLQNLSYKFDSLSMSMALLFAIMPFLFKENRRVFIVVSVICLILMFMSYQAANGIYIILSLFFAFSLYFLGGQNFKQGAIFLAICAMNLIVASLIYKLVFVEPKLNNAYASDAIIALNIHFFSGIWANLSVYITTIFNDLKQTPYIWLVALIATLFVINIVIHTNRPKIATIFGTILFIALGICLSYGLYLVLQKPFFEPRAFYGLNAFIATISLTNISLLNCANSNTIHKILHFTSATIAVITAYFLISFANIYGNALKKQDEYFDFRAKLLLQDLGNKVPQGSMVNLKIYLGYSAVTARFAEKYGAISRLVEYTVEYYYHLYLRLQHLNAPYNLNESDICTFIKENFGSEVILKNAYHTIERAKVCYIVTIK